MKNTTLGLKNEFFQPPASKIVNTFSGFTSIYHKLLV